MDWDTFLLDKLWALCGDNFYTWVFLQAIFFFLGQCSELMDCSRFFFILLFTVSLWPLLWHSINFAVYTIAVSDNAMANNVIIGGASLAKVFIPYGLFLKLLKSLWQKL